MDNELNGSRSFIMRRLPWLMGFAALLLYLFTLNRWISFANMAQVAKLTGFSWQTETLNPFCFLVSYPIRFLPTDSIPLAANALSAICGALVIGLLTRAVILLPQDRTHQQRERERSEFGLLTIRLAWLPPVMAAVVCALELSFWQHATNATPDMINLVLFAYAVRAILEFRIDGQESWLFKACLAYGLLMTSDWLALGMFPAFVAALIWSQGLRFFRARFLTRALLWGAVGLLLYFLLPIVGLFSTVESGTFWEMLKMNLGTEKALILSYPRKTMLLLALTSALPVLVLSFKWSSYFGDTSQLGVALASAVTHIVHALLLVCCVWVMFDPPFSPRNSGYGYPLLNLYFFSALAIGYYCGYFLLVFRPILARNKRTISGSRALTLVAGSLVTLLGVGAVAVLVTKNLPIVRENNHSELKNFIQLSAETLPKSGYLLSDDPRRALLVNAWLHHTGREKDLAVVETWPLQSQTYHHFLKRRLGQRWPFAPDAQSNQFTNLESTVETLKQLSQAGELYYLHPSFGVFFEHFYAEPQGMLYHLLPFAKDSLVAPPMTKDVISRNEAFWKKAAQEAFPPLLARIAPPDPSEKPPLRRKLLEILHLPEDLHGEARAAGALYSRSLNYWAVELQKSGDLEAAEKQFALAVQLNPNNVVAATNLAFNLDFRAGKPTIVDMPRSIEDRFGSGFSSWDAVLGQNGPYDEPNFCYAQGFRFNQLGLVRQAAAAFERVQSFAPNDIASRLWLGQLNLLSRNPDRTLALTREITSDPQRFHASATNQVDAVCMQSRALLQRRETDAAIALLENAVTASPTNQYLLANVTTVYSEHGLFTNALKIIEHQLRLNPSDPAPLLNKGFVHIQLNDYPQAILAMTHLLTVRTNDANALLNRAIAYLRNDQFDLARADYQTLKTNYPKAHQIDFGLGEIAYRRHETNEAIQAYQSYLSNAAAGGAEAKFVEQRLAELRGGATPKP